MEIDLYRLMEDTGFNKMITVKKLSELSEKPFKECKEMLDPLYEEYNKSCMCDNKTPIEKPQSILEEILYELREMNCKLDDIRGSGNSSIDDIYNRIYELQGSGLYNSITDVCDLLRNK